MLKKRIFIFIFVIFNIDILFASDADIFKYSNLFEIDIVSGKSLRHVNSTLDFNNTEMIKFANVSINDRNGFHMIKMSYENGLLTEKEEDIHDKSLTQYKYNPDGSLAFIQPSFKYIYSSTNCRDRFCADTFQVRERIINNENEKEIVFEKKSSTDQDDYKVDYKCDYFYDDENRLILFVNTSYKYNGSVYMINKVSYEYEDGKIVKLTETFDDLKQLETRTITEVEYYDKKNICKLSVHNLSKPEESYVIYFSDYDGYGNWGSSKEYKGEVLIEKVERSICYK